MTTIEQTRDHDLAVEAFTDRLFTAVLGAQEVQAVTLGLRLGWYDALATGEPLTSTELADRTSSSERYAREWLEHQAACGYVEVENAAAPPTERRFALPAANAEVLTDVDSLSYVAPLARFVGAVGTHLDALADAYRTGGGVSWSQLGADAMHAQAAANRPLFLNVLGPEYLRSIPAVDRALRAGGRVADIGCGVGWSSIGVALAYPDASVDGYDIDAPSIELARAEATEAGVADRVRFHLADAADLALAGSYDLVMALECIHDLPYPVDVLAAMRRLVRDDGTVLVMDERVAETFTADAPPVERLMYGYSLMCCLPDGMAHEHSAGTGTVMRPSTLAGYASDAGFAKVEVLPIENDFFRFYRLER
jgi:SAM-dependent methyltransferase